MKSKDKIQKREKKLKRITEYIYKIKTKQIIKNLKKNKCNYLKKTKKDIIYKYEYGSEIMIFNYFNNKSVLFICDKEGQYEKLYKFLLEHKLNLIQNERK
jgi:hypothetical protein